MAPVSCHYRPVSMDHKLTSVFGGHRPSWWMVIVLGVAVVILLVVTSIFAAMANREACKDGLLAEQKCRNFTHLLERQLTQAQNVLLGMRIQAATCNQTVVTLTASLETEKAHGHKQQELVQQLQGEIEKLKQKLQDTTTELEQLRKKNDASEGGNGSTSSGNTINSLAIYVLLTLSLGALLA
ncbi:bone marrow stromal antigen 2 [Rhinolophus sinicus]|uniref:bone marrow stromal antigen 2 n=1 Tax=Rhinolophus sinicus TaxID=89399 RepID=UPI003D7A6B3B